MDPNAAPTVNPQKFNLKLILGLIIAASVIIIISIFGFNLLKKPTPVQTIQPITPTPSVIPINLQTSKGIITSLTKEGLSIKTKDATASFTLTEAVDIKHLGSGSTELKVGQEVFVMSSRGRATSIIITK